MAQLALPSPSQGAEITVADFEVVESKPFDKFMSVMTDIRDSMGSIEDGFDAMIGANATPANPPIPTDPNEDPFDEPNDDPNDSKKPVVPDKSFYERIFEPMQNAIDGVSKAIMDSGGSDIQKGFKDLGFSSNEGFKLMEDAVDKLKGVGNILKGTGKLLISPFKAMSNSLFGASEDQDKSSETIEESQEDNQAAIQNHTEAIDENAEALGKTRDKEDKGRKGLLGGFNKFTLMLIAIVGIIMAVIAGFKFEAFAGIAQMAKGFIDEGVRIVGNMATKIGSAIDDMGAKMAAGAKKLGGFFDDAIKSLTKLIPGMKTPPKTPGAKTPSVKPDPSKAQTAVKNVVSSGDDLAKGAQAGTNVLQKSGQVVASGAKQLAKRLPLVGALLEGGLDAKDNAESYKALKQAYETQDPIVDTADGGKRPISPEEWDTIEKQYQATKAGSVGKATGSLAAGSAVAATAAPLLAFGPLGWLAYGTAVIGASIVGGMAGDKVATEAAETVLGVQDADVDFETLKEVAPTSAENIQAAQDGLDGENASADGSINQANATVINNNSYQGAAPVTNQAPVNDTGLNASLAT